MKMSGAPTGKIRTSNRGGPLRLHGLVGLALGVLCSALGTALMRHGDYGLSAFYAVSLALYHASGAFTMGTWNAVFQLTLILALMVCLRRVRWGYLASFAVVLVSSELIDLLSAAAAGLPDGRWIRLGSFFGGLLILSVGISLLAACKLPVMPINLFVREMAEAKGWPFGRFKLCFDMACLIFSAAVGIVFTGSAAGVGWGTVVSVFLVGPLTNILIRGQRRLVEFVV